VGSAHQGPEGRQALTVGSGNAGIVLRAGGPEDRHLCGSLSRGAIPFRLCPIFLSIHFSVPETKP